ncbi:fibrinogen-like protein 1, partial [Saccostrea cucullata]|uniref:fibrinogen-like protein 1 n=1 Tax=Saccostrea cuccullata TaxID=36930 RepID=UPI002ED4328A
MMFTILVLFFMSISQVRTASLLTGTNDQNSTALISDRRDIKEIDVLRQIINQETLIRVAVVRDVKEVVDDVSFLKISLTSTENMVSSQQQAFNTLKRQVNSLTQDKTLEVKTETLQIEVETLTNQNQILTQRLENLERKIDTLIKDTDLQQRVDKLKNEVGSLSREQRSEYQKITVDCENKIQETEQKLNRNIAEIYELLNNRTLQTVTKDSKINRDCKDHFLQGHTQSGVYSINPFGKENHVDVYCDMAIEGGGWTAIQKRVSGSVSFDRTWSEYKVGFGNASDSYWIGNDVIHQLTKGRNSSLYVSITLQDGTTLYELYQQFSVSDGRDSYRLYLGGSASGTLGDSMFNTGDIRFNLSGMYFSTPDRDNDRASIGNCAAYSGRRGGWWFNACHFTFLNGPWNPADWWYPWYPTVRNGTSIRETMMLIKR